MHAELKINVILNEENRGYGWQRITTLSVSRRRCSVFMTWATTALFVIRTPFGSPVVPLVYIIVQMSSLFFAGSRGFELSCARIECHSNRSDEVQENVHLRNFRQKLSDHRMEDLPMK